MPQRPSHQSNVGRLRMRGAVVAILALFPAIEHLAADIIVLDNGQEIQGEIIRETERSITVRFPGGTLELLRRRIQSIERQSRTEYLLEEGDKCLLRGSYREAAEAYQKAQELDASSTRARDGYLESRISLARSLRQVGRHLEAREVLRSLLADYPDESGARADLRDIDASLSEFRAELRRGLLDVRQGRVAQGVERLEVLFERFVDHREEIAPALGESLRRLGDRRLARRELEQAEEAYRRALEVHPVLAASVSAPYAALKLAKVQSLASEGDFAAVGRETEDALEVAPSSRPLRFYHALSLESSGKRRLAAEEYLALSGLERPADLEASVGTLRRAAEEALANAASVAPTAHPDAKKLETKGFRKLQSKHFTIHHRNRAVARDIQTVAENHYRRLFRLLGCETHLEVPIEIFVHGTREDYLAASGTFAWSGASHRTGRRMGKMTHHRIDCYQDQPRLESGILPHEIAHALLAHRLNYRDDVPLWANEGFAVLSEPSYLHRHYRAVLLQEKRRKNLLAVRDVLTVQSYPRNELVTLYYAQSYSLVSYLVELKGVRRFVAFLTEVCGAGGDLEKALARHYRIRSIHVLERRWLESI